MYMRFVQLKFKLDALPHIRQKYDDVIIPRLQKIPGCLCVCLVQNEFHREEGISITLWDSQKSADDYEKSGTYKELLGEIRSFLDDSSEWRIQLSENFELEYQPVSEEPVVKSFTSIEQIDEQIPDHKETQKMYVRIISVIIEKGKMEEFRRIYSEEILPILYGTKGCQYAFLTESIEEKNEVVSVTIWDSKLDADMFEKSGIFRKQVAKLKHTFSAIYQWKMALEKKSSKPVVTSDDVKVNSYSVVTGKSFY